jgi:hypothetical protein
LSKWRNSISEVGFSISDLDDLKKADLAVGLFCWLWAVTYRLVTPLAAKARTFLLDQKGPVLKNK